MGSSRRLSNAASFLHHYPDYDTYTGSDVWRLIGGSLDDTYASDSPHPEQLRRLCQLCVEPLRLRHPARHCRCQSKLEWG